jgi:teichuronic acid biosynthesis protein TuaE
MKIAELKRRKWNKIQNIWRMIAVYTSVIAIGVAIGKFLVTQEVPMKPLLVGIGALLGLLLLSRDLSIKILSLQRTLLYFTIIAGFIGPAVLTIPIGPIHLFPYRILLPLLWLLFAILFNRGRIGISHIKVKPYLQFLILWLLYAVLSSAWAASKNDAIRDIIFLFMGVSIIFFVVYYFSILKHLKWFYHLWLLVFTALVPIGIWETITGQHLSVSGLAQTTHPVARFMPSTVFRNPNDYATYLVLSLPFVLTFIRYRNRLLERLLGLLILIAGLYLLVATSSRASYLAALIGVAFWFFLLLELRSKIKVVILSALVVTLSFALFPVQIQRVFQTVNIQLGSIITQAQEEVGSIGVRINLIKNGLFFLWNTAGFGVGAGNVEYYMAHYSRYETRGILNLHNWWLENLANYGVFIFAGYVVFYLGLFLGLLKAYRKIADFREKMICEALLVGLVTFFFASVSSSSIMALRPQWFFFAFALAFLNHWKLQQARR